VIAVRRAVEADVEAMSALLVASITELCTLDHRNDPAALAAWTANKTPEGVRAMLDAAGSVLFVAEHGGEVAAVGCVLHGDEIGLNYVHPAHRFQGVSRALLVGMEQFMRDAGHAEGQLRSTKTAHRFYCANGWQDAGDRHTGRFIDAWPMVKAL